MGPRASPRRPWYRIAVLAGVLAAGMVWWAWSREGGVAAPRHGDPPMAVGDGFAWMRAPVSRLAEMPGLPFSVAVEERGIRCRRHVDGDRILVLTYERRGDRAAYGAYALHGAKNDLLLDFPLAGDPIAWPNRDHAAALAHQLALAGLDAQQAGSAVESHGAAWFAEGLRVFLVVPGETAEAVGSFAAARRDTAAPGLLLVLVDFPARPG